MGCKGLGCDGDYGDVWLPAGSDYVHDYDTGSHGNGSDGASCPDGFELVKVITDQERYGHDASYYCVEEC